MADGQVTMGGTVIKPNVRKTRKIGEHVIGGFAGAVEEGMGLPVLLAAGGWSHALPSLKHGMHELRVLPIPHASLALCDAAWIG